MEFGDFLSSDLGQEFRQLCLLLLQFLQLSHSGAIIGVVDGSDLDGDSASLVRHRVGRHVFLDGGKGVDCKATQEAKNN